MKIGEHLNLYLDSWIPVSGRSSLTDLASLQELLENGSEYSDIVSQPMTRIGIIKLLQAMGTSSQIDSDYFDLGRFLQVGGLPVASTRHPQHIIDMVDGNSVALSPKTDQVPSDSVMAQALITAYFCDRGGLKARVPGLPISAQTPLHVGRNIRLRRGATVEELLKNNPIESKGEYKTPWQTPPGKHSQVSIPRHDVPRDALEMTMWPWRRVQIIEGGIAIAPGAPMSKAVADPNALAKSKLPDLSLPPDDDFEVTRLVLNQALAIACWRA